MFNILEVRGLIALVFVSHLAFEVTPASPAHIHKHFLNTKEREQDGSYSPRDHNHITDGQHNKEFDHEAILGKTYCIPNFNLLIKML